MSKMSNLKAKPEFVCTLPKSALDKLMQVRKAFQNTLSENQLLKEGTKTARQQIKQLMAQISVVRAKLDQYEIQAGKLTDESVSRKVEMSSATKEKGDQTYSGQTRNFEVEMNRLKQQLQQRDSEILILKQEKDSLSAKLAQLQTHEKPTFVCTLPKSTLDDLIQVRKAFLKALSENKLLKEDSKTARQHVKQLMAQISMMRTKLDQYKIQAGEEREDQTCSDQAKILKQGKESLSAELAQLQKHEVSLKETLWNEKTHRENLEQEKKVQQEENKKVLEEQKVVKDTEDMQKKTDEQTKELAEAKTEAVETATPESSSSKAEISTLEKTQEMEEKLCVNRLIQLVVSQAIEKVSSKYKLFTERLTPDCISDRLIQKIWPEIELKHLDLSRKWLRNLDEAILKDLCIAHSCKDKHLIMKLREQLDNITVPAFTKKLLSLPRRVLSVSKHREEYKDMVKNVTQDLVMHAMSQENETTTWHPGTSDFIIQRLSHKIWTDWIGAEGPGGGVGRPVRVWDAGQVCLSPPRGNISWV
ncbi:intersectin-2-like [Oreochromis niloticus]|uniref:intersectin-2-like n=1 Tax=Oreochromis niloticus TaxID=8128 RepID=UPI0009052165|nr:intersectin-2-like [Oreochromis niloticus]